MTKHGIEDFYWEKMISVFKAFTQVEQVILYGSRAKGDFRDGSDIDLTLVGENVTHSDLKQMMIRLDDLNMPYSIDLSIRKELQHKELEDHIDRVGKIIYQRA